MKKFLLILVFFISFIGNAQQDTLAKKSYEELILTMRELTADSSKALPIARYYLKRAKKEENLKEQWAGLQAKAVIYNVAEDWTKGTVAVEELRVFTEENELEEYYLTTYYLAGLIRMREGSVAPALTYFEKAKKIAEVQENEQMLQGVDFFINTIKTIGTDRGEVLKQYRQQLTALQKEKRKVPNDSTLNQRIILSKMGLADVMLKEKMADSANYYINDILKSSLESEKDSCIVKPLYMMLGKSEILLEDYAAATKSLEYSKKYCLPHTRFDSLLLGINYGELYYKQNQFKKAITFYEQALDTYQVTDKEEAYMDDLYKSLAISYKETNDYDKASYYFEKYATTQTKLAKVQDTIKTTFIEKELEEFQAEIARLKEQKEESESNLEYLLLGGSIVILALLFLLLKFYKTKKANEAKFEALLAKIDAAEAPKDIIDTKDEVLEEKNTIDIPEETQQLILDGLAKLEAKEYFLSQECNSHNMAKKIGTNTSYLSKVINAHYGKNFNTYINDLRINYAIVRLKNDVFFRAYSIQSIAEEIGYKSADSFTKYFKKDTGLNPSFYIKNIKNIA